MDSLARASSASKAALRTALLPDARELVWEPILKCYAASAASATSGDTLWSLPLLAVLGAATWLCSDAGSPGSVVAYDGDLIRMMRMRETLRHGLQQKGQRALQTRVEVEFALRNDFHFHY